MNIINKIFKYKREMPENLYIISGKRGMATKRGDKYVIEHTDSPSTFLHELGHILAGDLELSYKKEKVLRILNAVFWASLFGFWGIVIHIIMVYMWNWFKELRADYFSIKHLGPVIHQILVEKNPHIEDNRKEYYVGFWPTHPNWFIRDLLVKLVAKTGEYSDRIKKYEDDIYFGDAIFECHISSLHADIYIKISKWDAERQDYVLVDSWWVIHEGDLG